MKYLPRLFPFLMLFSACEEKINYSDVPVYIKRDSIDLISREKVLLKDVGSNNILNYVDKRDTFNFSILNKSFVNPKNYLFTIYNPEITKDFKLKNSSFEETTFSNNIFDRDVSLLNSDFYKNVKFDNCRFLNQLYFDECISYEKFNIWQSKFVDVNFSRCSFSGITSMNDSEFNKIEFEKVSFDSVLIFTSSKFKSINFTDVQLPKYLSLVDLKLDSLTNDIDFRFCSTDSLKNKYSIEKCRIDLYGTDISKLILPNKFFTIQFQYSEGFDEISHVYESIIKKCNDLGMKESAEGWDIEYKKRSYVEKFNFLNYTQKDNLKRSFLPIGNFFIYINKYWWNFGYNKNLIFRNTFISFILCFMLFFLFLESFLKAYLPKENLGITEKDIVNLRINKGLRFKVSLFYTALIFFSWKMEHSQVNYKEHPYKTLCIYFVFTIGIIHLAYLAGAVLK
jgi:uncharacterized protein YjbI with pentapeptide repeats